MKRLFALAALLLSLNANAAFVHTGQFLEFVSGSGTPGSSAQTTPLVCPVGSLCHTVNLSVYTSGDFFLDYLVDYSEYRFTAESADVTLSWSYNDVNPTREANIGGTKYTGLTNNSGSHSFSVTKGHIFEFYMYVYSMSKQTEIHYQYAFSNIKGAPIVTPPVTPPVVQPVPVPSALALMLPLFAGFTLRKLSV